MLPTFSQYWRGTANGGSHYKSYSTNEIGIDGLRRISVSVVIRGVRIMAKVSKEGVFKVLGHIVALTVLVIGASASQQQEQGCCGTGGGSTAAGAGGDGAGGNGGDMNCIDHGPVDPMSPIVFFKPDVVQKIFQKKCSLTTSCHGGVQMGSTAQPYLGPLSGAPLAVDTEVKQVYMDIVGVAAVKEPGMNIVEPGHPETSFLMYKIDHELTCSRLKCGADCGDPMPQKDTQLTKDDRDTVRRWIAQGAQDN